MPSRFGAAVARTMSFGARLLGYFLYGVLRIVYRRDPKMIALFGGVACLLVLVSWLALD